MKAVLVVAWFGTRTLPITKTIPKEMLPVGSKPVIQYVVEWCADAGITDIIMITSQQKKALEDYFDKNPELEDALAKKNKTDLLDIINFPKSLSHISFVRQMQQLGTAHAILQVEPRIADDYFIAVFGDAIYPPRLFTDLLKKFAEMKKPMVCVHEVPHEDVYKYGVVKLDGDRMLGIVEKPNVQDAPSNLVCNGVYLLPKTIFDYIRKTPLSANGNEYLLPDALNLFAQDQELHIFQTDPFWDIGSIDLWMKANNKIFQDWYLYPPRG